MYWGPNEKGGPGYAEELAAFVLERGNAQPAVLWPRRDPPPASRGLGEHLAHQLTQLTQRLVSEVPAEPGASTAARAELHANQGDLLVIQTAGSSTIAANNPDPTGRLQQESRPWTLRLRRGEVVFLPCGWLGTLHREAGTRHILLQIAGRPSGDEREQ